ncbi:MAG: hypothetical protein ABIO04_02140 [Ferruginibacter sp.]
MKNNNIEKFIDETINSFDGSRRAEPKPFLLTRVMAGLDRKAGPNFWTRAVLFISRPSVAVVGILLILLMNTVIILNNVADETMISFQKNGTVKDDFTGNIASIYEIENSEP